MNQSLRQGIIKGSPLGGGRRSKACGSLCRAQLPDQGDELFPMPSQRISSAFGAPGMQPRWTRGDKDCVGTAYSVASKVWFTMAGGCVTEVYYPYIDEPQIRDLQFLISDGSTLAHCAIHGGSASKLLPTRLFITSNFTRTASAGALR